MRLGCYSDNMQFKGHYSSILVILSVCLCEEHVEVTCQMRFLRSVGLESLKQPRA